MDKGDLTAEAELLSFLRCGYDPGVFVVPMLSFCGSFCERKSLTKISRSLKLLRLAHCPQTEQKRAGRACLMTSHHPHTACFPVSFFNTALTTPRPSGWATIAVKISCRRRFSSGLRTWRGSAARMALSRTANERAREQVRSQTWFSNAADAESTLSVASCRLRMICTTFEKWVTLFFASALGFLLQRSEFALRLRHDPYARACGPPERSRRGLQSITVSNDTDSL